MQARFYRLFRDGGDASCFSHFDASSLAIISRYRLMPMGISVSIAGRLTGAARLDAYCLADFVDLLTRFSFEAISRPLLRPSAHAEPVDATPTILAHLRRERCYFCHL